MIYKVSPADRKRLAVVIGVNAAYLYQCLNGQREMAPATAMQAEIKSRGELKRWMLCQQTWHLVWPDLIGQPGVPLPQE